MSSPEAGALDAAVDQLLASIPATRRVERAIVQAYGVPVAQVMAGFAGRCLGEIREQLARAIGDVLHRQSSHSGWRVESGGRCLVDEQVDFEHLRILPGDCLRLLPDATGRPVVSVASHRLLLEYDHAVPRWLAQAPQGYCIVRPWQLSEWAIRCLCRQYDIRPMRVSHERAQHRGRHQKAVQRVFRQSFPRLVDNLLFAGEGVDFVTGQRCPPVDVTDRVDSVVRSVYAHPRLRTERRNLRLSLLRALVERSEALTLGFHLRADLPESLTQIPD